MKAKIEDTYTEAFDRLYCRVIVADDDEVLKRATKDYTATHRHVCKVNGVASMSAENYGRRLGGHNIHLRELFSWHSMS